jgi:Na+/H+ antiporter NhaD/arsenite permease-like protein
MSAAPTAAHAECSVTRSVPWSANARLRMRKHAGEMLGLTLDACLGGDFTLIRASANLVVAGFVAREGMSTFTFVRSLLWGFPLTLVALAIASVYVLLFQV